MLDAQRRSPAKGAAGILLCACIYVASAQPSLPEQQSQQIAKQFSFELHALAEASGAAREVRPVNPRLRHINGWVSSIGSSASVGDLDGDHLINDICLVDPRTDAISIRPAPGTGARYETFELSLRREPHDDVRLRPHDPSTMAPTGTRIGDINQDGLSDVVAYFWGRPPVAFLQRQLEEPGLSRNHFTAYEICPDDSGWYSSCLVFADLDGDRLLDIVVGNYDRDATPKLGPEREAPDVMQTSMSRAFNGGRNRFLLQKPTAGPCPLFEDASLQLPDAVLKGWTLAVGAADLDGDLLPEVYFANDFGPDRLLHNRSRPGKLNFAVLDGVKGFCTPNSKVLNRDSFKGMGVDFADLNGDSRLDILVSNIAGSWSLEESHFAFLSTGKVDDMKRGIAPYHDCSEPLGLSRSDWGWDLRAVDFNNDGVLEIIQATGFMKGKSNRWPELHELAIANDALIDNPYYWPNFRAGLDDLSGSTRNAFFVRSNATARSTVQGMSVLGRFQDISAALALPIGQLTRGISSADVDGDGDVDVVLANQWNDSVYMENKTDSQNSLVLQLYYQPNDVTAAPLLDLVAHPPQLASPAIGATVQLTLLNQSGDTVEEGRLVTRFAYADGGSGHSGSRTPQIHFGLGHRPYKSCRLDIRWRDRAGEIVTATATVPAGNHTFLLN